MSRNIFAILLILATVAVLKAAVVPPAAAETNGRIVGGQETTIAKYPYQVSMRLDTYILLHICGGSIYSNRVILTAAHCVKGRFASYIRIVAGSSTIADQTELGLRVSKLIYHPGFNKKTHVNDVGLIILAEDLVYSAVIQPISLATYQRSAGTKAVVTGWGKREEDSETLVNMLQEAYVDIIDDSWCNSQYAAKNYVITDEMICAGDVNGGKDSCEGDSGGPLVAEGKLLGIVSWGIGCARTDYPGIYASVPYHSQWIEENAKPYL